ncbi:MAG TPA: ribosomal protein S18-alanine N-acetyltransferase [Pyrinomonadaceae bacterium]|nr:ribosomal protein S18-alanine N-acetyltransferase [Pyrinomonadaceae bacterium]
MTEPVFAVSGDVSIAKMTEHDLLEVVEIEESSGLSRWGWAAYYAELQGRHRNLMFVARINDPEQRRGISSLAGYIVARMGADELHINNVAVRDEYRRRGIGEDLLGKIIEQGRLLRTPVAFLELRAGNSAALALYQKCGFNVSARRKNYYSDPVEDALVMTVKLIESLDPIR